MDAYLASGDLRSASNFYLNINFEVLNGCKLNCPGCHVEKKSQSALSAEEFTRYEKLLDNLKKSLYLPFIAFVGPTDFLSAENFIQIFSDPQMVSLIHNFKRLSLQTTYLDVKKFEATAEVLKKYYHDIEIEINIVIDPAKIMDDHYLAITEKNKMQFLSLLERDDVRSFGIMNVYDYDQTNIAELLRNYDFMHTRVSHLFETTIDYNFSFGRKPDLSNTEFITLSNKIKNLFNTSLAAEKVSNEKKQYLRFSFGRLTDSLIERQYNFRNGELYYSPLLYERFVSFRDEFKLPLVHYTVKEIEEFELEMQLKQYGTAPEKTECADCPFLGSCIDRGIIFLMDTFGTNDCLVAKNALFAVNSMGALPIHATNR